MASKMNTTQKVSHCLDYIDRRLETSSEQTIQIAEMIINDIKELTAAYPKAIQHNHLREHAERVRITQMKWVNQLHDIILEQTNRDLNGQVIQALQNFINTMNKKQLKHLDFEMPNAVTQEQEQHHLERNYLTNEQMKTLSASDIKHLPVSSTHH